MSELTLAELEKWEAGICGVEDYWVTNRRSDVKSLLATALAALRREAEWEKITCPKCKGELEVQATPVEEKVDMVQPTVNE